MNNGYIRISKDILNWCWYNDPNTLRVFIHLLLKANYKDGEYRGIYIKRGQVVMSRMDIVKELNLSEQSVRTALAHLKSTNKITSKSTNKITILTICNYDSWQVTSSDDNQQINQQDNQQINQMSKEQKESNKEKEEKEEEKKKNNLKKKSKEFVPPTIEEVDAYIKQKGYHFNAKSFVDYYAADDWHYGKGGNRVKVSNWKRCCVTWEDKRKNDAPSLFDGQSSGVVFPSNPRHGDKIGYDWFYDGDLKRWIKDGEKNSAGRIFSVQSGKWLR